MMPLMPYKLPYMTEDEYTQKWNEFVHKWWAWAEKKGWR